MSARISNDLRIACTIGLAASLAGACSSINEERDLPACDGTTYVLESAITYQLIEGFSPLRLTCIEANAADDAPHATLAVSWPDGVKVRRACIRPSRSGRARPLTTSTPSLSSTSSRPPGTHAGRHRWLASSTTPGSSTLRAPTPSTTASPSPARSKTAVLRALVYAQTVVATTPHQTRQPYPLPEAPPKRTVSSC